MTYTDIGLILHFLLIIGFTVRVLLRPHRDPTSRFAWIAVISTIPYFGIIIYILFGELNIGLHRRAIQKETEKQLVEIHSSLKNEDKFIEPEIPEKYLHFFKEASSINGLAPVGGNKAILLEDSQATFEALVADIDSAKDHVHLLFYIWLPDNSGRLIVEALKRAASRGVTCRAMVDALGSRTLLKSKYWKDLSDSGVKVATALPIRHPMLWFTAGRMDLRNHRKIMIIDGTITYCGSQNCADPEFLVKKKYAPWVDAMIRFEGPVALQNQFIFTSDWQSATGECLGELLRKPLAKISHGFTALAFGTGPTIRYSAMPEMFETLFHGARHELTITTPYFVPNDSTLSALCAAAHRGVKTTIVFPARNDSFIVGASSRSFYTYLLEAGVTIYEYNGGLLHTKSLTLDGDITLIGSANMDRRSFDLNYENNILLYDVELTQQMYQRQQQYILNSNQINLSDIQNWSIGTRLANNTLAIVGPLL